MVRSIPSLGFDIPSFEIHHSKPWTKYDSRDQSKKTTTYSRLTTFVNSLIMIDEITKLINTRYPKGLKRIDYYQILNDLEELPEDIKDTFEYKCEQIAFSLMPQHSESSWGTYYGSYIKGKKEDGTPVEYPSREQITEEVVNYWRNRVDECENPYLRFRYCDLVYDLGTTLLGQKFDYKLLDKLLSLATTVADDDYPSDPYITCDILERAFRISKTKEQRDKIKQAFNNFENKYANNDSHPQYWGTLFSLMLEYKKDFSEQEISTLVKAHEARFKRLRTPDADGIIDDWVCKDQAVLLCKYYRRKEDFVKIQQILFDLEEAFKIMFPKYITLQRQGILQELISLYTQFDVTGRKDALLAESASYGKEVFKDMSPITYSIEYPPELIKEIIEDICINNTRFDPLTNFALYFLPNKATNIKQMKDWNKEAAFLLTVPTQYFDKYGRPLYVLGSIGSDEEGHLMNHYRENLIFDLPILNKVLKSLTEQDIFTVAPVILRLKEGKIPLEEARIATVEQALKLYFDEQYCAACHLLIPQIEAIIRQIVDSSGYPILKEEKGRNKGYQYTTLDELLRCPVFGEDVSFYLRATLTSPKGLNIRNNLCHGLVSPNTFNVQIADRLIHILVLLIVLNSKQIICN